MKTWWQSQIELNRSWSILIEMEFGVDILPLYSPAPFGTQHSSAATEWLCVIHIHVIMNVLKNTSTTRIIPWILLILWISLHNQRWLVKSRVLAHQQDLYHSQQLRRERPWGRDYVPVNSAQILWSTSTSWVQFFHTKKHPTSLCRSCHVFFCILTSSKRILYH